MRKQTVIWAALILLATVALAATVAELIVNSEKLWVAHKYSDSTAALEEALKANPTPDQKADIMWRKARNLYDTAEEMPQNAEKARMANYMKIQDLANECKKLAPKMAECYLWLGTGLGREGTQKGIINTLGKIAIVEGYFQKAIQLGSKYRAENGTANTIGDAYYALSQFYRLVPDSAAVKLAFKAKGDKQKSVEMMRKAYALEPKRVEYVKELGISLICLGQTAKNPKAIDEGMNYLKTVETMATVKPTDDMDKKDAKKIMQNQKLACGYSRDKQQQEVKDEDIKKK